MQYAGGFYDSPGGPGYANCPYMLDPGVFRLFYKDLSAMSVTSLNIYMVREPTHSKLERTTEAIPFSQIYGGTNWGHTGWDKVYTSYDFRAAIAEDRSITREKYSEIKLQSQFLKASPAFLTTRLATHATSAFTTNNNVVVTQTKDAKTDATFWTSR